MAYYDLINLYIGLLFVDAQHQQLIGLSAFQNVEYLIVVPDGHVRSHVE